MTVNRQKYPNRDKHRYEASYWDRPSAIDGSPRNRKILWSKISLWPEKYAHYRENQYEDYYPTS